MKLQEGVDLHFIPTTKFTTNMIKIRFAAPMRKETVAGRVLVANILEVSSQEYPTTLEFRRQLAQLYGATFSTSVSQRGEVHLIDITISYVRDFILSEHDSLTGEILDFLASALYKPLASKGAFNHHLFEVEQQNLISFLESEVEDNFYHADMELNDLFFEQADLKIPRVATAELVKKETAQSVYQAYKNMLMLDKIDIFVVGKVNQKYVKKRLLDFPISYRKPILKFEYCQPFSTITREKIERKKAKQSILQLAYHLQVLYSDVNYPALIVFNSLFGNAAHSKLFVTVREKEGLAYTIGSSVHIFSGFLKVYAGIAKDERLKVMQLIRKQLSDMKRGLFTDEELKLTKELLIQSASVAQDKQSTLIEQVYNQEIYGADYRSFTDWVESVKSVSREDVIAVSKLLRLQAVYFMEGIE